ncbi:MAG: HAMP domain-containing sensor histidine kinase, partial [Proteocatella sp.]
VIDLDAENIFGKRRTMKISLKLKLIISYVLILVFVISSLLITSNFMLEKQFQSYVQKNQEQINLNIVNQLAREYDSKGNLDENFLMAIGEGALGQGIVMMVNDTEGKEIFCMSCIDSMQCENMINAMESTMIERYPNWDGEYTEKQYEIRSNGKLYGTATLGYYGPFYYNSQDIQFIGVLNRIFLVVSIVFAGIAILLGYLMANRIAKPIRNVIEKTAEIGQGKYENRISCKSNVKELCQLVGSVNNLANTLEIQQEIKKRMASDYAHEFRTPLTSLQINMEGMIDEVLEISNERLEGCLDEILRLSRMVSDIDKIVELENESLILNREIFDVSALIKAILRSFEGEAKQKNIQFEFTEKECNLLADKDKISQVFINLISNAVKYTDEGTISIGLEETDENLKIKIKDTGIGISEEDVNHIFEYLYRADESRDRQTGGSGIGLSIVKSIVMAHGGTIDVSSILGEGTEFVIKLNRNY